MRCKNLHHLAYVPAHTLHTGLPTLGNPCVPMPHLLKQDFGELPAYVCMYSCLLSWGLSESNRLSHDYTYANSPSQGIAPKKKPFPIAITTGICFTAVRQV